MSSPGRGKQRALSLSALSFLFVVARAYRSCGRRKRGGEPASSSSVELEAEVLAGHLLVGVALGRSREVLQQEDLSRLPEQSTIVNH